MESLEFGGSGWAFVVSFCASGCCSDMCLESGHQTYVDRTRNGQLPPRCESPYRLLLSMTIPGPSSPDTTGSARRNRWPVVLWLIQVSVQDTHEHFTLLVNGLACTRAVLGAWRGHHGVERRSKKKSTAERKLGKEPPPEETKYKTKKNVIMERGHISSVPIIHMGSGLFISEQNQSNNNKTWNFPRPTAHRKLVESRFEKI